MNNKIQMRYGRIFQAICLAVFLAAPGVSIGAANTAVKPAIAEATAIEFAPQVSASIGKSALLRLPAAASRVSVGDKTIADVILLNPREIYLLGKKVGTTNIILWSRSGQSTVIDVQVGIDPSALQGQLNKLMPGEKDIKVSAAADSLVLTGSVADAMKAARAAELAEAFAGKKVVNMLKVTGAQQVMLEVKIAEVQKNVLDQLGASMNASRTVAGGTYSFLANFLTNANGSISITRGNNVYTVDAQNKDDVIKILAEPTIMAISGQEGSFLAGGKVYITVAQPGAGGVATNTLEEKEFGIALKFTPTVLEGDLVNLKVAPEVTEISQTGFVSGGTTLPAMTTRRAATTVQLHDGQSFAIAGLIKNNVTESVQRFPMLGDLPILGALFRSSSFQNDKTELLIVITPRLVKPLSPDYALPTDNFTAPGAGEFFLGGKMEGSAPAKAAAPAATQPATPAGPSGFEMK
jgi:pilus assembly protein CpaC